MGRHSNDARPPRTPRPNRGNQSVRTRTRSRVGVVFVALLIAGATAAGTSFVLNHAPKLSASGHACPEPAPHIVVSAAHADLWRRVAHDYNQQTGCKEPDFVAVADEAVTSEHLADADAWLPSDTSSVGRYLPETVKPTGTKVVATTPIVMVSGSGKPADVSKLATSTGPSIIVPNPAKSVAGSLAVVNLVRVMTGSVAPIDVSKPTPDSMRVFALLSNLIIAENEQKPFDKLTSSSVAVTTEQVAWSAVRDGTLQPNMVVSYPAKAGVEVELPLVRLRSVAPALTKLEDYLLSTSGQQILAQAGLRPATGTGIPANSDRLTLPTATVGSPATAADISFASISYIMATTPSSSLVLLDSSGSMTDPLPGGTLSKIETVRQAAIAGYAAGASGRSGLITFQADGSNNAVIRERAPLGPDSSPHHLEMMMEALTAGSVGGGTPLYNAVVFGYKKALEGYTPGMVNRYLIISDGENADTNDSISLESAVQQLKAAIDPKRPIEVVAVGVGGDANLEVLSKIAGACGGRTIPATTQAEVPIAFLSALYPDIPKHP
jgi:extracellular solute-binding protein/von Willebrand factor type A domain-containing protein